MRKRAGKTQQVLATALGITTKSLVLYEQGNRLPEPRTLLALAAVAEVMQLDEHYSVFIGDALIRQLQPPPGWELIIQFRRMQPDTVPVQSTTTTTKRRRK